MRPRFATTAALGAALAIALNATVSPAFAETPRARPSPSTRTFG